jgi:hypothetical protein
LTNIGRTQDGSTRLVHTPVECLRNYQAYSSKGSCNVTGSGNAKRRSCRLFYSSSGGFPFWSVEYLRNLVSDTLRPCEEHHRDDDLTVQQLEMQASLRRNEDGVGVEFGSLVAKKTISTRQQVLHFCVPHHLWGFDNARKNNIMIDSHTTTTMSLFIPEMDTPTPAPLRCPASRPRVVYIMMMSPTMRKIMGPNSSIIVISMIMISVVLLLRQGTFRC